ncbi:MAG: hypothetical protein P4L22_02465 [Candidatus Babeliales bacterium]|nr:hypothetical protein [Candidatus Babeliales bacterium]
MRIKNLLLISAFILTSSNLVGLTNPNDVSDKIQGKTSIVVTNDNLGGDPVPGVGKVLVLLGSDGSKISSTKEGDTATIPSNFTKALYGTADKIQAFVKLPNPNDVSDKIQGKTSIVVTNDNLGGDPAPWVVKVLVLLGADGNQISSTKEGDTATIPSNFAKALYGTADKMPATAAIKVPSTVDKTTVIATPVVQPVGPSTTGTVKFTNGTGDTIQINKLINCTSSTAFPLKIAGNQTQTVPITCTGNFGFNYSNTGGGHQISDNNTDFPTVAPYYTPVNGDNLEVQFNWDGNGNVSLFKNQSGNNWKTTHTLECDGYPWPSYQNTCATTNSVPAAAIAPAATPVVQPVAPVVPQASPADQAAAQAVQDAANAKAASDKAAAEAQIATDAAVARANAAADKAATDAAAAYNKPAATPLAAPIVAAQKPVVAPAPKPVVAPAPKPVVAPAPKPVAAAPKPVAAAPKNCYIVGNNVTTQLGLNTAALCSASNITAVYDAKAKSCNLKLKNKPTIPVALPITSAQCKIASIAQWK